MLVRGKDVRDVKLADLMDHISMVFQRVYLFQDTIYNNIAMGRPDATREEVLEAARKARCYDFVMALPDGFDTVIGEGGESLSGGERQRISIARCILKDAPIVILDEATASVDADNESYIQQAITRTGAGQDPAGHRPPAEHHPGRGSDPGHLGRGRSPSGAPTSR